MSLLQVLVHGSLLHDCAVGMSCSISDPHSNCVPSVLRSLYWEEFPVWGQMRYFLAHAYLLGSSKDGWDLAGAIKGWGGIWGGTCGSLRNSDPAGGTAQSYGWEKNGYLSWNNCHGFKPCSHSAFGWKKMNFPKPAPWTLREGHCVTGIQPLQCRKWLSLLHPMCRAQQELPVPHWAAAQYMGLELFPVQETWSLLFAQQHTFLFL